MHDYCAKLAIDLNMYLRCDEGVTQEDFREFVSEYHHNALIKQLPKDSEITYNQIKEQLRYVAFKQKLGFTIRHLKNVRTE